MVIEKILAVMGDLTSLPKTDRNEAQHFVFRGVDAVVNAVGPLLRSHGLVVYPSGVVHQYRSVESASGKAMGSVIVEVTYCWTDGTPDGDLYVSSVGEAFDAGDKATPKAMSVAYRTMLLQTLCLPTGEVDPDAQTYKRSAQPASGVRRMWALLKETHPQPEGESDDVYKALIRAYLSDVIGREVTSTKDLTPVEVSKVIEELKREGVYQ